MTVSGFICQQNDGEMRLLCPLGWTYTLQSFPLDLSPLPSCLSVHALFLVHFLCDFCDTNFLCLLSRALPRNITNIVQDQLEPVPPVSPDMHCMSGAFIELITQTMSSAVSVPLSLYIEEITSGRPKDLSSVEMTEFSSARG